MPFLPNRNALPIITPCYKFWEIPYYWAGLKAYDFVAGTQALFWSYYMTARSARYTMYWFYVWHTLSGTLDERHTNPVKDGLAR